MHIISYFFQWPIGQVWPNLIAAVIWATPAFMLGFRKLKKQRDKHHLETNAHINHQFVKLTEKIQQ